MKENHSSPTGNGRDKVLLLPLERRVLRTMRKHRMIQSGDHVLVGVSGGADSTTLLASLQRLAPRLGISLSVAHLNHRMRGAESDADEEFVRQLSAQLSLPFLSEAVAVQELSAAEGRNLEEVAREVRYAFLKRAARHAGAGKIAVGHSMNDQAETVLLRLLRGSGIEGVSGIHPVLEGTIIRPLIECSRQDILEYLACRGLGHREDTSNRDLRYRRNRLRQEWIPYLEKNFNPRLIETLAREAELARETAEFLGPLALREYESLRTSDGETISLPIEGVNRLHAAIRKMVLRIAIREARGSLRGITSSHIEETLHFCGPGQSGRWIRLPGGIIVGREFKDLVLRKAQPGPAAAFCYPLPVPGRCDVQEAGIVVCASFADLAGPTERSRRVFLDADSVPESLVVRSRQAGDRYGGTGHRKVKKMLIDAKVGHHLRRTHPVIAAGKNVIWVPGFEPARPFRAKDQSRQCVVLEIRLLNLRRESQGGSEPDSGSPQPPRKPKA